MGLFELFSLILVVAAVLAWINRRFLGMPTTIGVTALALALSLLVVIFAPAGWQEAGRALLAELDFSHALLDVVLAFLLFAGALHVKVDQLYRQKWIIGGLATVGVVVSTFLVGLSMAGLLEAIGAPQAFLACLLFGALIAPTDPIAVLAILKDAHAPKSLEAKIAGESLFNDGVGVVVFLVLVGLVGGGQAHAAGAGEIAGHLVTEVGGSLVLGAVTGAVAVWMLRQVDHYQVEVLLTLALCAGLYSLAHGLGVSGPLAVVVAGLLVGNTGRRLAMSERTVERLDIFWELVDEILNVALFALIGLEVLVIELNTTAVVAGLVAIPVVLAARLLSVGGAIGLARRWRRVTPHAVKVMTWGGLRGGISVALALSLPADFAARDLFVTMTYVVVLFSILVQGPTVGLLVRRIPEPESAEEVPIL